MVFVLELKILTSAKKGFHRKGHLKSKRNGANFSLIAALHMSCIRTSWQSHLDVFVAGLDGYSHQADSVEGDDVVPDVEQARASGRPGLAELRDDTGWDGRAVAGRHHHQTHQLSTVLGYGQLQGRGCINIIIA